MQNLMKVHILLNQDLHQNMDSSLFWCQIYIPGLTNVGFRD